MPSAIARSSTVPLVISYTTANSMVSSRRRNCRRARVDIAHSSTVLKHVTATSLDATPGMEAAIAPPSARLNAPLSTIAGVKPRKVSVPATRTVGLSVGLGVLGDDEGRAEGRAVGAGVVSATACVGAPVSAVGVNVVGAAEGLRLGIAVGVLVGCRVGGGMLSQQFTNIPFCIGQHKNVGAHPCALHRGCAPHAFASSGAVGAFVCVGRAVGRAIGDGDGHRVGHVGYVLGLGVGLRVVGATVLLQHAW